MPKWTKEDLEKALKDIRSSRGKSSIRSTAYKYGIPVSTLHNHLRKTSTTVGAGRPTVLTFEEEKEVVYCCQVLQEVGFGLTKEIVSRVVRDYVTDISRHHPFYEGVPGKHWWSGFLARWPSLVQRKPQHLPKQRAIASNSHTVQEYFKKVEKKMHELGIMDAPDLNKRIWNCDECGLSTGVASNTVLAKRGSKWVHETGGGSGRETITILGCGSAAGQRLPPFVVHKGKNLYSTWTINGPEGACYSVSDSGWMEPANFESWFKKSLLPHVAGILEEGPILLFLDGHHSHLSISFIELAKSKNVHPFCLPSHTSHFLQPLDVGVYGPLKKIWKSILKEYKISSRATNITKQDFPSLLKSLWDRGFQECHLKAGFRECGLYPVNPHAVPGYKTAPSLPFITSMSPQQPPSNETPLRTQLREYFVEHLRPKNPPTQRAQRKRIIHATGEALTNDSVLECLKAGPSQNPKPTRKRVSKKAVRGTKRAKTTEAQELSGDSIEEKDTEHCFNCGKVYVDGEEDSWVGCDTCYRWYHIWCAGFQSIPDGDFVCKICIRV